MSKWSWYQDAYEMLQKHLLDAHQEKWQYNDDELRLFEDEFVYGEFKDGDEHQVSCPWCDCDFKIKFKTYVKMVIIDE